jgi:hypothetical protein
VVEGAEEKHRVDRGVAKVEARGVTQGGINGGMVPRRSGCLLDVQRHDVAVMHSIARIGEPQRVPAWPAAHVSYD